MKKLDQSYVDFLYKNYGNMPNREIAKILGKSIPSIKTYAYKLGLKKEIWTQKEINFLIGNYRNNGPQKCADRFQKTYASVQKKAMKLKLCKPPNPQWSKDEITILRKYYPIGGVNLCNLNRSNKSIRKKAYKLGLKCNGYHHQHVIDRMKNGIKDFNCSKHGKVEFYLNPSNKSLTPTCKKCILEKNKKRYKKYSKDYLFKYMNRIRSSFYRLLKNKNAKSKKLSYNANELFNHLEKIKKKQNNKCPMCHKNYHETKIDIDHIIPTNQAKTLKQIKKLFELNNLTLLCWRCNRFVKKGSVLNVC
jgi:hypothetical protein